METTTPQNESKIDLGIKMNGCILDGITLYEYFPTERVEALLQSDHLKAEWNKSNYSQQMSLQIYQNEKCQLQTYLKNYNKKAKAIPVKYCKPKHKWGRVFPTKSLGITCFRKKIRNTLIKDLYYDFDLKNAQVEIVRNICQQNNIDCPSIEYYCNNREETLELTKNEYNVDRDMAKKLFLRLCFFGSFDGFCQDNKIENAKPTPFITDFTNELKTIANTTLTYNEKLYNTARKTKENKEKKNNKNYIGAFYGLYLQEYETRIVSSISEYLINNTKLLDLPESNIHKCGAYEYDGLKLLKENVDKYPGGVNGVLKLLIEKTKSITNFDLIWEEKAIDQFYDISTELNDMKIAEEVLIKPIIESKYKGVHTESEAAKKMIQVYPHWVYCQEQLYVFDNETGMWSTSKNIHRKIIKNYSEELHYMKIDKESGDWVRDPIHSYGTSIQKTDEVLKSIQTEVINNNWLKQMEHTSLHKLLFNNGYFDGDTELFYHKDEYKFNPDIMFMGKIHHDFTPLSFDDANYADTIFDRYIKQLIGEDDALYLFTQLSRALMGDVMKKLTLCLGPTNGGKSSITKMFKAACGDYCGNFNAENLSEKKVTDEAQAIRWALLLKNKRIIFSNEMKMGIKLDCNIMKKFSSGGDELQGRSHCEEEKDFTPHFMMCLFANDFPEITGYDEPLQGRTEVYSFNKQCVDKPLNKCNEFEIPKVESSVIELEIKTLKFQKCLVQKLIQAYVENKEDPVEKTQSMAIAKSTWIQEEPDILKTFLNDYEITDNLDDFVTSQNIVSYLKEQTKGKSIKLFANEMHRYCKLKQLNNVYPKPKKIRGKTQNVWYGIKEIDEILDV